MNLARGPGRLCLALVASPGAPRASRLPIRGELEARALARRLAADPLALREARRALLPGSARLDDAEVVARLAAQLARGAIAAYDDEAGIRSVPLTGWDGEGEGSAGAEAAAESNLPDPIVPPEYIRLADLEEAYIARARRHIHAKLDLELYSDLDLGPPRSEIAPSYIENAASASTALLDAVTDLAEALPLYAPGLPEAPEASVPAVHAHEGTLQRAQVVALTAQLAAELEALIHVPEEEPPRLLASLAPVAASLAVGHALAAAAVVERLHGELGALLYTETAAPERSVGSLSAAYVASAGGAAARVLLVSGEMGAALEALTYSVAPDKSAGDAKSISRTTGRT